MVNSQYHSSVHLPDNQYYVEGISKVLALVTVSVMLSEKQVKSYLSLCMVRCLLNFLWVHYNYTSLIVYLCSMRPEDTKTMEDGALIRQ